MTQFAKGIHANAPSIARPIDETTDPLKAFDPRGLTVKDAIAALKNCDPDHEVTIWLPGSRIRLFGKSAFKTAPRQVSFEGTVQSESALDDAAEALRPIPIAEIEDHKSLFGAPVDVRRIVAKEGDCLIVKYAGYASHETHEQVRRYFADKVPAGVGLVVIDYTITDVTVLAREAAAASERLPPAGFTRDPHRVFCSRCNGSGRYFVGNETETRECDACGGDGRAMLPTSIGIAAFDPKFGANER